MASIGSQPGINNPGDLTVTGPTSFLYPGQNGVYASPNGHYYATFPTPEAGSSALSGYIANNVGTDPNTSITTPSELASYFLNGTYGPLTNTADNPNAGNWLQSIMSALTLGPNDPLSQRSPDQIAAAIANAEGNGSGFSATGGASAAPIAKAPIDTITGGLNALINAAVGVFQRGFAERATSVIVGVVFVLLAIAAMVFSPQINAVAGGAVKAVKTAV